MDIQDILLTTAQVTTVVHYTYAPGPGKLTEEVTKQWVAWGEKAQCASIVEEKGASGDNAHLHILLGLTSSRDNIPKMLKRHIKLDNYKKPLIVTRYPRDVVQVARVANYHLKEEGRVTHLNKGWEWERIAVLSKRDLKRAKDYDLNKAVRFVSNSNAETIIVAWAKEKGFNLVDKVTFIECMKSMVKDGFIFRNVRAKNELFANVMAMTCGDTSYLDRFWEQELNQL